MYPDISNFYVEKLSEKYIQRFHIIEPSFVFAQPLRMAIHLRSNTLRISWEKKIEYRLSSMNVAASTHAII